METTDDQVRGMLGRLRSGGWVASVMRGMTERRQHRFFLTNKAVDALYVTGHQHPSPREEARAAGLSAFPPVGRTASGIPGAFSPWVTTTRYIRRTRKAPLLSPVNKPSRLAAAPTTSTRPGPPRHGASRPPCAAWPCWSRSTAWPPTCCVSIATWNGPGCSKLELTHPSGSSGSPVQG